MITNTIQEGIIIGAVGGACAGIAVYFVQYLHEKIKNRIDSSCIHKWLKLNTKDETGSRFRSTRAISSWTNITEERVRQLCSTNKNIYLSLGPKEDMWGIFQRETEFPKTDEFIST